VVTASKSKAASKASGSSKIVPLADRLVVKNVQQEETLASGLVIPDTAKEKPQQAEVVAVGPGRVDDNGKRVPMEISVGDIVVYAKYSGNEIKLDQEEYLILSEKDVLAKIAK
jgi:chaperonin GroES